MIISTTKVVSWPRNESKTVPRTCRNHIAKPRVANTPMYRNTRPQFQFACYVVYAVGIFVRGEVRRAVVQKSGHWCTAASTSKTEKARSSRTGSPQKIPTD